MKQKIVKYQKFNTSDIVRLVTEEIESGYTVQCMMEMHDIVIVVYNESEVMGKFQD
jgi:hypothetical protein